MRKLRLTETRLRAIIRNIILAEGDEDIGSAGEDTEGRMGAAGGSEDADSFDDAGSDMESRRAQMQARTDKAARDNDTRHQKDARGTRLSKQRGGGGPKAQDMR